MAEYRKYIPFELISALVLFGSPLLAAWLWPRPLAKAIMAGWIVVLAILFLVLRRSK